MGEKFELSGLKAVIRPSNDVLTVELPGVLCCAGAKTTSNKIRVFFPRAVLSLKFGCEAEQFTGTLNISSSEIAGGGFFPIGKVSIRANLDSKEHDVGLWEYRGGTIRPNLVEGAIPWPSIETPEDLLDCLLKLTV
ncbi:MAG: hypothetical protein KDD69_05395 [Bdellovibrionales bacterium]|nr:hypothetical protein [Bdellovibrionales bacterium]